jgi:gluconate 2-dehydrogenase gamma chain
MDRRVFLAMAAAVPLYAGPLVLLSGDESKVLEALVDQVVPPDELAVGAAKAGVVFYIDKQLAGPLKRYAAGYRKSLPLFKELLPMTFEEQTAYLKSLEDLKASFFAMVVDHTMQGFYGSPAHGGNVDEASWNMLGIQSVMGGHAH